MGQFQVPAGGVLGDLRRCRGEDLAGAFEIPVADIALRISGQGVGIGGLSSGESGAVLCRSVIAVIPAFAGRLHPYIDPPCRIGLCLL